MPCKKCQDLKTHYCPDCGRPKVKQTKEEKLAETLHKIFCNGSLSCRWRHESDDWIEPSHKLHLNIATEIITGRAISSFGFCIKFS